jgi:hypothetical protein
VAPPAFDFAAVEALWLDAIDRVVAKMAEKTETFYAIALHGGYAEAEGPVCPPALAMNSAEGFEASGGQDDARSFTPRITTSTG